MEICKADIDDGKSFDWGRTSQDYAKYRDIYPSEFYQKILDLGLCKNGQKVLDVGTGTGVLPRNMYQFGADWMGTDIAENQIAEAKRLAQEQGMHIAFETAATEDLAFPDESFNVITACQCFFYFDHAKIADTFARILKPNGKLLVLYMAWLPFEDDIAMASEELILKYNPGWTGCRETRKNIHIPDVMLNRFELNHEEICDLDVPFTRESWHGRMRACRGVGASLSPAELAKWEKEHSAMLNERAPKQFTIKHYMAFTELSKK